MYTHRVMDCQYQASPLSWTFQHPDANLLPYCFIPPRSPVMISKSTLGRLFFALALVASGILQLATGEFVRLVLPLPAWIPGHSFLAYLVGVILILAGAAIGFRRGALGAAGTVGVLLLLSLVGLQIPKALADPWSGFQWTNPCKALALLGGLIVLANSLPEIGASSGLARLFRRLAPLGPRVFRGFPVR